MASAVPCRFFGACKWGLSLGRFPFDAATCLVFTAVGSALHRIYPKEIYPSTVFGAFLVGGQTPLDLQLMYLILADFEPM